MNSTVSKTGFLQGHQIIYDFVRLTLVVVEANKDFPLTQITLMCTYAENVYYLRWRTSSDVC